MTLYDDMMEGAIDVHCHIDFEFSAKERKREPEFLWLPKAEALGMRGVVLKSHWWPTINVVPYILSSVETKVALWSSVALNSTAGGPNPCIIEACAELGGKMVFLPTWSARNDVERKGFSSRIKSYYKSHAQLENPNYYFLDDKGKLIRAATKSSKPAKRTISPWAWVMFPGRNLWNSSKPRATWATAIASSSITCRATSSPCPSTP